MNKATNNIVVIIPTLNEEKFIERCLLSVQNQTYFSDACEVLVVDGGSKDHTREIVQVISSSYPNIRLIDNPHRYQSAAFNIGVKESKGKYIIRMDAHAQYEQHYIERCIQLLEEHEDYGNVGGQCKIIPQNNHLVAQANALLNHLRFGIGGADFRVGTKAKEVDSVPFGAFRREVIEHVGGMRADLARGEDNEYNSRIRQAGYKVWFDPQIQSYYYARATISSSMRQMYLNGKSIGNLVYVDPRAIGLRHLVPFCFVIAMIIGIVAAFFSVWGKWALFALLAIYFIAAFIADISACRAYGWKFFFILPLLFFLVHCSYGIGTIIGLLNIK